MISAVKIGGDSEHDRPRVNLLGQDGNAFMILGACALAGRRAGWSTERIAAFLDEATKRDYASLLVVVMNHFDVH